MAATDVEWTRKVDQLKRTLQERRRTFDQRPATLDDSIDPLSCSNEREFEERFTKVRELGRGSQGHVDLVHHKESGQRCALKTVKLEVASASESGRRLSMQWIDLNTQVEVEALRRLSHRNITRLHGAWVSSCGSSLALLTEFANGGSFEDLLRSRRPLDEQEALDYIVQVRGTATNMYF